MPEVMKIPDAKAAMEKNVKIGEYQHGCRRVRLRREARGYSKLQLDRLDYQGGLIQATGSAKQFASHV